MHWWVKKMCSGPSKPKHSKAASHITIVAHTCIRPAVRPQCSTTTILELDQFRAEPFGCTLLSISESTTPAWLHQGSTSHQRSVAILEGDMDGAADQCGNQCGSRPMWAVWKRRPLSSPHLQYCAATLFLPTCALTLLLQNVKCFNFPLLLWPLSDLLLG